MKSALLKMEDYAGESSCATLSGQLEKLADYKTCTGYSHRKAFLISAICPVKPLRLFTDLKPETRFCSAFSFCLRTGE